MDRTASALTATFTRMQPAEGRRALEPWEADSLEDVLDAAAAWDAGQLDLNTAAKTGVIEYEGRPSPRYSRFIALTITPRDDPRWHALDRLICTIVGKQMIVTTQGVYDSADLHIHDQARAWIANHERAAA